MIQHWRQILNTFCKIVTVQGVSQQVFKIRTDDRITQY